MSSENKSGGWGCLVVIGLAVAAYLWRADLAKQGVNTANFGYGVMYSHSLFCKKRITSVYVENPGESADEEVRLEIEILRENGDVIRKVFEPGTIESKAKWESPIKPSIDSVKSIKYLYTTKYGASTATLDFAEPKEYSQDDLEEFKSLLTDDQVDAIGRMLLTTAHPTGDFRSTPYPEITLTDANRTIRMKFSVSWTGGITGDPYDSAFTFEITKDGLTSLRVTSDTAQIAYNPNRIRELESQLRNNCE